MKIMKIIFIVLFHITFIFLVKFNSLDSIAGESIILHNKRKMISNILIIAVTILMLGSSSYSSASLVTLQSEIDHYRAFAKKQYSGINSSKDMGNSVGSDNSGSRFASSSDKTLHHRHESSRTGGTSSESKSIASSSGSSSSSDTKSSSDNSNNESSNSGNNNKNNQSYK